MFPVIDAETKKKNLRALAISMIGMLAFGMTVAGAAVTYGSSPWFLTVTFLVGIAYTWGTAAFIVRTER